MLNCARGCWIVLLLAMATGCEYSGAGQVSIYGEEGGEPTVEGVFDDVLYQQRGGTHSFIAYQRITTDEPFQTFYRNRYRDPHMTSAELRVQLARDGSMAAPPVLLLHQGDRVIRGGPLMGDVAVEEAGDRLLLRGDDLRWATGAEGEAERASFDLNVYNVLAR